MTRQTMTSDPAAMVTPRILAVDDERQIHASLRLRLAANQKTKEKVGVEINTAIDVFKKTHVK